MNGAIGVIVQRPVVLELNLELVAVKVETVLFHLSKHVNVDMINHHVKKTASHVNHAWPSMKTVLQSQVKSAIGADLVNVQSLAEWVSKPILVAVSRVTV